MNGQKTRSFFIVFFLLASAILVFLNTVIVPLVLALVIAYLLNPVFETLEKKHIKRSYLAIGLIFCVIVCLFLIFWVFLPIFFAQLEALVKLLPDFKNYLENSFFPRLSETVEKITGQKIQKGIHLYDFLNLDLEKIGDTLLPRIGASTRFLFSFFITVLLTPFFLFFLLRDFKKLHNAVFALIPDDIRPFVTGLSREIDKTLRSVIRGQLLVIMILCVLYPTAFLIVGLPAAIAVGILTGLARLVPYMDVALGGFLCFFVLATNTASGHLIFSVCIAFLVVQSLDGLFITPRIMGKSAGLHPFLVIIAVLCFGSWFGFYGVLLAVPLSALLKVVFKVLLNSYKESSFFKHGNR